MTTPDIITASMAASALLITLMLLTGTILGGNLKEKVYRWFFAMLIFNLIGCLSEFTLPFLFGTPGNIRAILIHVTDFVNYACASLTYICFAWYLHEFLSMKKDVPQHPFIIASVVSFVNIPLIAVAEFIPLFAWLDENNYFQIKDTVWILSVFLILPAIVFIAIILRHIRILKPREWISLLVYMIMPLLCYVIELIFTGVWLGYFGSTLTMFLIHINIQVELSRKIKEKDLEMAESRIAIMLSQIQPHFLYNSLAAIENLCIEDPMQARNTARQFAKYLRGNLDSLTQKQLVGFEQELKHVQTYMSIEQTRFREKLRVVYEIEANGFPLPALTVQPIMENAVRNGVNKKNGGGTVILRTDEKDDCYLISIIDDGVGFNPGEPNLSGRSHIGISNVRERLAAMCNGTLHIESAPGEGTTATIMIPKGGRAI